MNVLISGGCKNGKTGFALKTADRLACGKNKYYVATMIPCDDEDRDRINRHIAERADMGFKTLEVSRNIGSCIEMAGENGTFLIDSITALLLNEMFSFNNREAENVEGTKNDEGTEDSNGTENNEAVARCIRGLKKILERARNAVFVTDYIYSDAVRYDAVTENYRASLAAIDRFLAKECDVVIELCAGARFEHKGGF